MNEKGRTLFDRLKSGLEEGIQFARGELSLRTITLPQRPPQIAAHKIRALRRSLEMSQPVFARLLNVSTKTVQSWEQGTRKPSQAALRLLQILSANGGLVCRLVGMPQKIRGTEKRPRRVRSAL